MSNKVNDRNGRATSLPRRRFLKGAGAGIVVAPAFLASARGDSLHLGSSLFALGVASGDPDADSVVLWTRLVDDPLTGSGLPNRPLPVGWEIATDYGMRRIVGSGTALARPENGHALRIVARGLPADQWLYFRFAGKAAFRGHFSRVGRTRTFPRVAAAKRGWRGRTRGGEACRTESMRFAVVSCQNYEQGYFPAYADIASQDIDFVLHTGDYIYEDGASGNPLLSDRNHTGGELFSIEDYRNRYALYRLDSDLQDAHAHVPFIVSWDDHEVDNNYAGLVAEEGAPYEFEAFAARRRNAYRVYSESMPIRTVPVRRQHGSDGFDHYRIFRKLEFGGLADIHILDTRQYRSDQPAGDGFGSTDSVDPATRALIEGVFGEPIFDAGSILDPAARMLGWPQLVWLASNLIRSLSVWNLLSQQVMLMPWNLRTTGRLFVETSPPFPGQDLAVGAVSSLNNILNVDAWDGYPAARERLTSLLDVVRPPNPVILTGDIHSAWAANILDDFGDPATADVIAVEFVCTSISSTFLGPDPRPTDFIVRAGIPENPHIRYFDGRFRGYALCDVDPSRWLTTFRGVGDPLDLLLPAGDPGILPLPGDSSFTVAEAEIPAGFSRRGESTGLEVRQFVPV